MAGLAAAVQVSAAEALDLAQSQSLRLSGDWVHVQIVTHAPGLENAIEAITDAGGEVTGVGNGDTLIQGWLPVEALETLAAQEDIYLIRRPAEAVLLEDLAVGNSTTEGLAVMNGPAWHTAGYTGSGVKVGIIDGGFEGYTSLLGTDLPASVTVRNFVDGEDQGDIDDDGDASTENHGLACAEIIHDTAPGATLYLAKILTNVDLQEAVAWLKDTHGVDIISTSLGWYNITPGDGTGEFADLVEDARDDGILWVTAASNDREAHWGGLYYDPDADDVHNFNGTQEVNYFGDGAGGVYSINPGYQFAVFVRWNDWTNVNQDYDLYLLRWNGSSWDTIGSSTNAQNGSPGQTPTEFAVGTTTGDPTYYGFVIERVNSNQTVNFEIFVPKFLRPDEILHARSLSNLADAPDAMTVAALDVTSPYPQESYSSEGPTNGPGGAATGGSTKPDISGFANVSTESYGAGGFNGTSAATPHVAGAAALVLNANPSYTPAQLQTFLEGRAIDMGSAGMDTIYGYGRLYLGSAPSNGDLDNFTYLPLIARRWPPLPYTPVLNPISNPDGDGNYPVSWGAADLADTYTLWEDDNAAFSSPTTRYSGSGTSWNASNKPIGTYYYQVRANNSWGSSGWSNVRSVTVQSGCIPDPPGESDNINDALTVCSGQTVSGRVSDDDLDDVYKILTVANQELTISMNGSGGDADLYLYPPDTTDVDTDPPAAGSISSGNDEFIQGTVLVGGFWYVDVFSYEGTTNYNVTVTLSGPGASETKTFSIPTGQIRGRHQDKVPIIPQYSR
jgi:subtilisin family serine protease